jgi:hypothetical protein
MFSLIIALVAIALVAVLAGASVYYGSDAFQGNKSKARYAEIVNQSEQISSAFLAFKVEGNSLDSTNCNNGGSGPDTSGCLSQLVDANYLSAIPERNESGMDWKVDGQGALFTTTKDAEACILANEAKGYFINTATKGNTDADGDGVPDAHVDSGGNSTGVNDEYDSDGNLNSDGIHDAVQVGAVCVQQ